MADNFGCSDRKECRKASDPKARARFNHAEGDLHNLWPALGGLNSARGKKPFGEVADKTPREVVLEGKKFSCNFFADKNVVEPRDIVKGNLARSIFYMCKEYRFHVAPEMLAILKKWNESDPPTAAEQARNGRIESVQGNRNSFIDRPSLAKNLRCN